MFIEIKAMMEIGYVAIGSLSVCYINTSDKLVLLKACSFLHKRTLLKIYVIGKKYYWHFNRKFITYKIYNDIWNFYEYKYTIL